MTRIREEEDCAVYKYFYYCYYYQSAKFQLPSSISFGDTEEVPK